MNQNRNNNRRRGRGNNRGQGGGGNQGNRIDNRARGNAPQLLEKYRKLAHDASLNGDRVQTEYYLQFADHYFRVIADSRSQKDEGRPAPREREGQGSGQDFEDDYEDEFGEAGRQRPYQTRRERDEEEERQQQEGEAGSEGEPVEDAVAEENPFVRDGRSNGRRGRGRGRDNGGANPREDASETASGGGFDPGLLPPSIARESRDDEEAPRPRRTRRPRATERPADEGDSEPLEAVG